MLTDLERALFSRLAWLEGYDSLFLGEACRPLSLGSLEALEIIGCPLEATDAPVDDEADLRQAAAYLWLHTEPLAAIGRAIWSGGWRHLLDAGWDAAQDAPALAEWRELRERHRAVLAATRVDIRPRPAGKADDTPSAVIGPGMHAFRVRAVAAATGWPREEILWRTPAGQAMQVYHAAARWEGLWTVPARPRAAPAPADEFAAFDIAPGEE